MHATQRDPPHPEQFTELHRFSMPGGRTVLFNPMQPGERISFDQEKEPALLVDLGEWC